jgi:uncharacterized protein (TIGR03067 family)
VDHIPGDAADAVWTSSTLFHPANLARLRIDDGSLWFLNPEDGSDVSIPCGIDHTKTPKTLDLMESGMPPLAQGIYEVKGNQLKICLARYVASMSGNERPKDFSIAPNSGDVLLVLEHYQPVGDEKAIQGEWAITSATEDGRVIAEDEVSLKSLNFGDGIIGNERFWVHGQTGNGANAHKIAGLYHGKFVLNPAGTPRSITLFNYLNDPETHGGIPVAVGIQKDAGIYKFDGDRLTIAFRAGDKPPESFESKPGSGVTLLVLEKPKTKGDPTPSKATPKEKAR